MTRHLKWRAAEATTNAGRFGSCHQPPDASAGEWRQWQMLWWCSCIASLVLTAMIVVVQVQRPVEETATSANGVQTS